MKMIHIPSSCPKCENEVLIERLENKAANVYCMHCDFILSIEKRELEYLKEYLTIE